VAVGGLAVVFVVFTSALINPLIGTIATPGVDDHRPDGAGAAVRGAL
jgi:hypothetical protein